MKTYRKKTVLILAAVFTVLSAVVFVSWTIYYNQPLNVVELKIPRMPGTVPSIEFTLPRGDYIIKAVLQQELQNKDKTSKIHYWVTIPQENINIDEEANINFQYRASENWFMDFKVKRKSTGKLSVELLTPNVGDKKINLIIIKKVLFRTVE